MKTAVLIGASGLIGNFLLQDLLAESSYQKVIILVRRLLPIEHKKLQQIVTDFTDENILKATIKGDDLFICTGTTIKKAGSKANFRAIDFSLPLHIATIAAENKMKKLLLVSSAGATKNSLFFYPKIKGELENEVVQLSFENVYVFRPSLLLGNRTEKRLLEIIFQKIMTKLSFLMKGNFKKYAGIKAEQVAAKMVVFAQQKAEQKICFIENQQLF
ncbi:MAG: hypothetical protein RL708_2387 [Bacteroidota bacterium]|jgi:uncharacterized protein YbjT (DUF2867 family)